MKQTIAETVRQVKEYVNSNYTSLHGVCFDYFDTLVSRTITPEYTKILAAEHLAEILNTQLSGTTLYEIRRELEVTLCHKNVHLGGDPEFDLYALAEEIFSVIIQITETVEDSFSKAEFVDIFADLEIAVEIQVQKVSTELVELLTWLRGKGLKTYLLSDFYIPIGLFRRMLKSHGLENLFTEVFISADHGKTKSSGKLFEIVRDTTGCCFPELVMIGDNEHSDFSVPQSLGIRSYLIDIASQKELYLTWQKTNTTEHDRCSRLQSKFSELTRVPAAEFFPEMATTLWLFITKLFSQLLKDGRKSVFFCSKEGEFLGKLFKRFQEIVYGRQIVPAYYLLVSRKATFVCSLRALPKEDFHRLFDQYRDLSLEEFLLSLNFSMLETEELCNLLEIDQKIRHFNLKDRPEFEKLVKSKIFHERYEQHRNSQKKHFRRYLDSFGVHLESEGLTLVDVGWKGSIQNNIFHVLDEQIDVQGYYIGLLSPTDLHLKNKKKGILFSDYPEHTPFVHVYNNNRSLFEMMLGATHGSADGYFPLEQFSRHQIERKSTVHGTVAGKDGSTGITVLDLPAERELYETQIQPLQDGIFSQFEKLTKAYVKSGSARPNLEWFARQHARMVFLPTVNEVDFYANLYHLENFGLFEFTRFGVEESPGLFQRLRNFNQLLRNSAAVLETGVWPPIIFRKSGLHFLQRIDGLKRHYRIFRGGPW